MFRSNVYKTPLTSGTKENSLANIFHTKVKKSMENFTLFRSFVSLSMKFEDSCETTGRKTAVNGSN